jgi:nucleotide-binding universal stress UspA family protein
MERSERTSSGLQRADTWSGPGVVVVGVDETVTAQRAASYAAGIARRNGALLIVVYVKPPLIPVWGGLGVWGPPDVDSGSDSIVLERAVALVRKNWEHVEMELRVGDSVRELCRAAEHHHADMVIVGSSRCLRHRLCGSVSSRLLARGHWPVVVVP